MKDNSSDVCREIINTKTVIQNTTLAILVEHLVSTGKIKREECKDVGDFLNKNIEVQMSSLVDRVLKSFQRAE